MKVKLYDKNAEVIGETELPKEVFEVSFNADVVHQAARILRANQRRPIAHAKGRSEVRGGGKKPWPQKGTGRARHGSRRSPLWRGGGVTHGPTKERSFSMKLNKKMRKIAVMMVLSEKARNDEIRVFDDVSVSGGKTKEAFKTLEKFIADGKMRKSALILLPKKDSMTTRAYRNIDKTKVVDARSGSLLDLLNHKFVIMPVEAIPVLESALKIA